ncbi:MAG: hypothetical protein R3D02_12580 [Hyphomicrobiales bacterium]
MLNRAAHIRSLLRRLPVLLAAAVLFLQFVLGAPVFAAANAALAGLSGTGDGAIVICTSHGFQTIRLGGEAPLPKDGPHCPMGPCCIAVSGNDVVAAVAVATLPLPADDRGERLALPGATVILGAMSLHRPLSRGPPVSV